MDYRIFDVCTRLFLLVRIHTGVGHTTPTARRTTHFDSEKLTNFSCAPGGGLNFGSLDLESGTLTNEPPRQPCDTLIIILFLLLLCLSLSGHAPIWSTQRPDAARSHLQVPFAPPQLRRH